MGKVPAVQIWANKTLPPEMLAASDSVLKTASYVKIYPCTSTVVLLLLTLPLLYNRLVQGRRGWTGIYGYSKWIESR